MIDSLAMSNMSLKEILVNNEASRYIEDNFEDLVLDTFKIGKTRGIELEKCHDLVSDLYVRITEKEQEGDGFDPNGGKHNQYMTVRDYIYASIKAYSKNTKYRKSREGDFKLKEVPASSLGLNGEDNINGRITRAQFVYNTAVSYNEIEDIDIICSISEEIEYILNFEKDTSISLRYLIKNFSSIAEEMACGRVSKRILNPLNNLLSSNKELKEALYSVMETSIKFPQVYTKLVEEL